MTVGLKVLLLAVALILFFVGVFVDDPIDVMLWGFVCLAAAFIVEALGLDRPLMSPTGTARRTP